MAKFVQGCFSLLLQFHLPPFEKSTRDLLIRLVHNLLHVPPNPHEFVITTVLQDLMIYPEFSMLLVDREPSDHDRMPTRRRSSLFFPETNYVMIINW